MKIRTFLIGFVCCMMFSEVYAREIDWSIIEKRSLLPGEETESVIEISAFTILEDVCIEITNLSGTIVYRETVTIPAGSIYSVYTESLPQGSYLFTLTQGEESTTLEFER